MADDAHSANNARIVYICDGPQPPVDREQPLARVEPVSR